MIDGLYAMIRSWAEAGWLPPAFEHAFMARALIAALLVGPLLSALGTVVVARRLTFFTEVVGHATLTGVALGLWLGEDPGSTWVGPYMFCVAAALVLEWLRRTARLPHDTLTGVVLVASLGLGLWLLAIVAGDFDVHRVEGVLFGSPLTLGDGDLLRLVGIFVVVLGLAWRFWNPLMLGSLSPTLLRASATKRDPAALDYGFVVVLTAVVVASVELIGALLVLALVSVPAAAAQTLARGLRGFFALSLVFGLVAAVGGLWLSALGTLPPGGAIALIATALFILARLLAIVSRRSAIRQTETPW